MRWFELMRSCQRCSEVRMMGNSVPQEWRSWALCWQGWGQLKDWLCFPLIPRLSCWPLAPCAGSRHGSATSQSSARASLPIVPPTSTRWMAPPVRAARLTATTACASPTRSSASSCGGLVSEWGQWPSSCPTIAEPTSPFRRLGSLESWLQNSICRRSPWGRVDFQGEAMDCVLPNYSML